MAPSPDLAGQVFGRWTVLRRDAEHPSTEASYWVCRCECGIVRSVQGKHLRGGRSTSCGGHSEPNALRHGHTRGGKYTSEYAAWCSIIQRCENSNHHNYKWYGGRGIRICDRWRTSFEAFLADVGSRPSDAHSIDRINNDGNYEPGNVRWATKSIQDRNRSSNRLFTINGRTLCMTDWAREYGMSPSKVRKRLERGWPVDRALTA